MIFFILHWNSYICFQIFNLAYENSNRKSSSFRLHYITVTRWAQNSFESRLMQLLIAIEILLRHNGNKLPLGYYWPLINLYCVNAFHTIGCYAIRFGNVLLFEKNNELKKNPPNCSTNLADTKLSELFGAHILKVACILQKMSLHNAMRLFQIQSGLVYPAHNSELVINAQCQRWRDINQSNFAVGSTQPQCGKTNSEVINTWSIKKKKSWNLWFAHEMDSRILFSRILNCAFFFSWNFSAFSIKINCYFGIF